MPKIALATRKNASLTLAGFLVVATAWWYSQQPGSPAPPPPPGDTTVVIDPPDTTTPPTACTLTDGTGNLNSSTCLPCQYTPPGPNTASISSTCVPPPANSCTLIDGSGEPGSGTCTPCGYNPPGASYATVSASCVAPPAPEPCVLHFGTGVVGSSTCQPCPYNPPGQSYASIAPSCVPAPIDTTPAPPDTTSEPSGTVALAVVAELPRNVPQVVYPTGLGVQTTVPDGANLQTYINAAAPGTELLLTPGAVYTGNFTLPNKGSSTSWIVVRTNVVLPNARMTPTVAAAKNLASICTNNFAPAIATAAGAHHYWFTGVKFCNQFNGINVLVKIGENREAQTTVAQVPHHITFDRYYSDGGASLNIRRNFTANGSQLIWSKGYADNCHDSGGDSQCILGWNGSKEILIEDNDLIGGHEVIMWGGGDAAAAEFMPQDIVVRHNHIWRPASWKPTWQVKNLYESKASIRTLIENNVFENHWLQSQAGFAFVAKSENQDGTAPWSTTQDFTFRYNFIRNISGGWNLSGSGTTPNPITTAARYNIHDNWVKSGMNVDPYTAESSIGVQMLSNLHDIIFAHNTIMNNTNSNQFLGFDGSPLVHSAVHSNLVYQGLYGVKGSGQSTGLNSLTAYAGAGYLFSHNIMIGDIDCSVYPANNFCVAGFPTSIATGWDSRRIGADTLAIISRTSGAVVAP